jgi:hypothetical protein
MFRKDKYIICSMVLMGAVCIWHAIVATLIPSDVANKSDKFALIAFGVVFIVVHVTFFVVIYIKVGLH